MLGQEGLLGGHLLASLDPKGESATACTFTPLIGVNVASSDSHVPFPRSSR